MAFCLNSLQKYLRAHSVSSKPPYLSLNHFENAARELIDNVVEELELCVALLGAWPGEGQGDAGFEFPRRWKL